MVIEGRVQGVFFRASAKKIATHLGICGWVKNTDEGNVEVWAEGTSRAIEEFRKWCAGGPPDAEVTRIWTTQREPLSLAGFEIVRD